MIDGLGSSTEMFLANLGINQGRLDRLNNQITSGVRVSVAADDPTAVRPILAIQAEIARVTQVQSNLTITKADTDSADSALQSAMSLLDDAIGVGAQGASTTATATAMTAGANKVADILDQMVGIANTTVNGRYIFGGDASATAPYANGPAGVQQLSSAPSTRMIEDAAGGRLQALPPAQEIFHDPANSVFQSLTALHGALASGDPTTVQAALANVKSAQAHVSSQLASVGDAQNWIARASTDAASRLTSLQAQLSAVRDTDMPTAITQLTLTQTAQQAAIAAEGQTPRHSLFDYLG